MLRAPRKCCTLVLWLWAALPRGRSGCTTRRWYVFRACEGWGRTQKHRTRCSRHPALYRIPPFLATLLSPSLTEPMSLDTRGSAGVPLSQLGAGLGYSLSNPKSSSGTVLTPGPQLAFMVHLRRKRYHSGWSRYRAHGLASSFLLMGEGVAHTQSRQVGHRLDTSCPHLLAGHLINDGLPHPIM